MYSSSEDSAEDSVEADSVGDEYSSSKDSPEDSVEADSAGDDDSWSKAVTPSTAERISGGANDTEVSDESQILFLIDSQSGNPNTTINAFDRNGNLVPRYSIVIPEASLPICAMGFTVVGFNLYMFGGQCLDPCLYGSDDNLDDDVPVGEIPSLDTYTYVLDSRQIPGALESGQDLFQLFQRCPRMNRPKVLPIVYVVNQTFYVLSRFVHSDQDSSFIDFESRGLGDSYWDALPNPPVGSGSGPDPSEVVSHALLGDRSIAISLEPVKGIYVFSFASSSWTCVDTKSLCFISQPIWNPSSRLYYALSPSGSALVVFNDILSIPEQEFVIREAASLVGSFTSHHIATLNDVIFIFRTGSPSEDSVRPVYLTIDKYKVSDNSIIELGETISYLVDEGTSVLYPLDSLYLIPVSLD